MKYRCKICGFIHEGVMPDGYFCPLCRSNYHEFKIISQDKKHNRIEIDDDNPCINRIKNTCINCGTCAKTCEYIVGTTNCINCGQCILTCPTESITPKYVYQEVLDLIKNPEKVVIVMTSPAVRVSIGEAFGYAPGEFLEGKMISALKKIGFDHVYDLSFGSDVLAIETEAELKKHIADNKLPLITNCCPSWVKYLSNSHPEFINNLSSCKTSVDIESTLLKKVYAQEESIISENLIVVALTSCTSKKEAIINTDCDYSLTTKEFAYLIREEGIDFKNLAEESFDYLIGSSSGYNFDTTGGLILSTLRVFYYNETKKHLTKEELLIKEKDFGIEYSIKIQNKILKGIAVSRLYNFEKLLPNINEYVLVEVMNCTGGCINGGGGIMIPNMNTKDIISKRKNALFKSDKKTNIRYPYQNPIVKELYSEYLTIGDRLLQNVN